MSITQKLVSQKSKWRHLSGGNSKSSKSLARLQRPIDHFIHRRTQHTIVIVCTGKHRLDTPAMSNFQLPAGLKPAQGPPSGGSPGAGAGGEDAAARAQQQAQAQQQEEEMRRTMLGQILEPNARERCECLSIKKLGWNERHMNKWA